MQGSYNMIIRCNQRFMFCKDRGIVWFCGGYAWYSRPELLGFPILQPGTFGDSTLSPGTTGILTLPSAGRKNMSFQLFNRQQKLNFRSKCDKN